MNERVSLFSVLERMSMLDVRKESIIVVRKGNFFKEKFRELKSVGLRDLVSDDRAVFKNEYDLLCPITFFDGEKYQVDVPHDVTTYPIYVLGILNDKRLVCIDQKDDLSLYAHQDLMKLEDHVY